jgi:hypothetical protein
MHRRFHRIVLFGLLVVSSLAGSSFHRGSVASSPEPQFSAAAATLIEQSGQIGKVYISGTPGLCYQSSAAYTLSDEEVDIYSDPPPHQSIPIAITASPGRNNQKVTVLTRLYQHLDHAGDLVVKEVDAYPYPFQPTGYFSKLPAGPDYVLAYRIIWYASDNATIQGQAVAIKSEYIHMVDGVLADYDRALCDSPWPPTVEVSATSGTVNSPLNYWLDLYPLGVSVNVKWDGKVISSTDTNNKGQAFASGPVPASPMGPHTVKFTYGHWTSTATFTVKPRIKLTPSTGLKRGQTVNVSLRGYAKYEVVRIRWKKGISWVELARLTTSGTGSANIDVKVPSFAVIGTNSVRGDGTYGHAQTNAVTVVGSSTSSSVVKPTPSPTASPTESATPEAMISETAPPEPSPPVAPTEQPSIPEVTATMQPTDTTTPTVEPTEDMGSSTETPTVEPTAVPSETPAATATEGTT